MKCVYHIRKGESLSHWVYSGIKEKEITAPPESFYAPVNMTEGYVQIVYPQRKWFLSHHNLEGIERSDGLYPFQYFPFEDTKVNFSTARKVTTHLWTYLKSCVTLDKDSTLPFSISTCGAVKLWVDGTHIITFSPYDRNIPHKEDFTVTLSKGEHSFELYADELAERDVFFYFDFIYNGNDEINQSFEIDSDPELIHEYERFLESLSLTRTTYSFGGVEAEFDSSMLTRPIDLEVQGVGSETLCFIIEKGMSKLSILPCFNEVKAKTAFFTIRNGNVVITRKIYFNLASNNLIELPHYDSLEERKKEALLFAARYGSNLIHQAMAMMKLTGSVTAEARKYIEKSLDKIERKEDCADFVLAPLLWSMLKMKNLFPLDLYERAKNAVLGFRYWIDEEGNDAMWYFSENHAFLFNVSQYLAGILFPDETFTVSRRKGLEQRRIGKSRLFTWFRNFNLYRYAEWNSATYFPVDLIGLFSLYEGAEDDDMKEKAEDVLDYTFRMIQDNSFHGLMSSSYGRAYEMTVKAKEINEPSFLSYIAYGEGTATESNRAAVLFSLSSYTPPESISQPKEDEIRIVKAVQGEDPVWTYSTSTPSYIISSAENFRPFMHGHQQHIMDITIGRKATFFINHPGERAYSGENRPSYWAGNGTLPLVIQYKALMLLLFDIQPDECVKYIHAYFPTWLYDEWSIEGNNVFARSEDGYIGAYFSSSPLLTKHGMNRHREIIAHGTKHLAVVRVSDKRETGSYENFKELFRKTKVNYCPEVNEATCIDFAYGSFEVGKEKAILNGKDYDYRCLSGYEVSTEKR